jgi:hypothetical protein
MLQSNNLFNFFDIRLLSFLPLVNSYLKKSEIKLFGYYKSKFGYFLFFLRFLSNLHEQQIISNLNLSIITTHKNLGVNIQQNKIEFNIEPEIKIEIEIEKLNLLSNYLALPKHFLSPLAILIGQINRKSSLFETTKKQFYFTQTQNILLKKYNDKIFQNLISL